jgi:hypothetical protein
MTTKLKVTLVIIATLIIGIVLGVVGRGVLMKHHRQKLDKIERTELFLTRINEAVDPDSSQKPKVEEIAKRTAERIEILFDHHQSQMATLVDSMKRELSAILTPSQQQRLDQELTLSQRSDSSQGRLGVSMAFSYEYAERLQRELNLDSAQTGRMLLLIRESHDRIMNQTKSEKGNSEAARKRREAFVDETNKKIEALLDAKQKEHFRQLRRERERFVDHELREEDD